MRVLLILTSFLEKYFQVNNIHEKISLNSDWLRAVQFFRNTVQKKKYSANFLIILRGDFFVCYKTDAYNISLEVMTKFKIFIFRYVSQSANKP
jgi:hypothetical protein